MPAYGRGGAGNIQAVNQETAKVSADVEANGPAVNSSGSVADYQRRQESQYVHAGRGGAGNYTSTKELNEVQRAESGTMPASQTSRTPGRGGAGNYEFGAQLNNDGGARELENEEQAGEKLKQDIEKGVDEQLAAPPKARLPGGQPY